MKGNVIISKEREKERKNKVNLKRNKMVEN